MYNPSRTRPRVEAGTTEILTHLACWSLPCYRTWYVMALVNVIHELGPDSYTYTVNVGM